MLQYKNKELLPKTIKVALHHTAVSRSLDNLQAENIRTYHGQEWASPSELNGSEAGYNFICEPTGNRTQERYIGEETIAQVGNNCDVLSRCGVISYVMVGDFRVEKPTAFQVDDFKQFIAELEADGFTVELTRHADVQPGRICPIIPIEEIESWFETPDADDKDAVIAVLRQEIAEKNDIINQLTGIATLLIKILKNK